MMYCRHLWHQDFKEATSTHNAASGCLRALTLTKKMMDILQQAGKNEVQILKYSSCQK